MAFSYILHFPRQAVSPSSCPPFYFHITYNLYGLFIYFPLLSLTLSFWPFDDFFLYPFTEINIIWDYDLMLHLQSCESY